MPIRFTNNQRARLQMQLQRDYELLTVEGCPPQVIYETLVKRVHYNLSHPGSALYDLPLEEKQKVLATLNTFFEACPEYQRTRLSDSRVIFVTYFNPISPTDLYHYNSSIYCPSHDALFTWLMLDTLMLHSFHHHGGYVGSYSQGTSTSSNTNSEGWALLLLIALAALAVAAAFVAMYYLFSQFLDDMERFWHNEGWIQAAVSMMAAAASGLATGLLTFFLLQAPIISLAIAAGVSNPVGIAVLAVVCLSIIGAGLGCFITNKIQDYSIRKANPDAIDVYDAHRFELTDSERENLETKGYDADKVLNAMIAIRQTMGKEQLPSLLGRVFTSKGREKQELLDKIRQLRKGEIDETGFFSVHVPANEVTKADAYTLQFNLKNDTGVQYAPHQQQIVPVQQYYYPEQQFGASQHVVHGSHYPTEAIYHPVLPPYQQGIYQAPHTSPHDFPSQLGIPPVLPHTQSFYMANQEPSAPPYPEDYTGQSTYPQYSSYN